jgi:hypothetical protein
MLRKIIIRVFMLVKYTTLLSAGKKVKVKLSRYRPGQAFGVSGG